jgi:hypothetical protein
MLVLSSMLVSTALTMVRCSRTVRKTLDVLITREGIKCSCAVPVIYKKCRPVYTLPHHPSICQSLQAIDPRSRHKCLLLWMSNQASNASKISPSDPYAFSDVSCIVRLQHIPEMNATLYMYVCM